MEKFKRFLKNKQYLISFVFLCLLISSIFLFNSKTEKGGGFEKVKNPNVILITLETVRSDHTPCYGYRRNTTPNLCEVAEDGVLFENAYAQGTHTRMSLPTLITSRLPSAVGMRNYTLPKGMETLSHVLNEVNYTTLHYNSPFSEGFQRRIYINNFTEKRVQKDLNKFLLWAHIWDSHTPFAPREEYRKWDNLKENKTELEENWRLEVGDEEIKNLYDGNLLQADSVTGKFLEELKERGIYDSSLIIITSDHGTFLDHERFGHWNKPYEEQIHVPLVIKFPENKWQGKRIEQPVRHIDIVPIIYDYLNLKDLPETSGKSLIPTIRGKNLNLKIVAGKNPAEDWTVRQDEYKYFLGNVFEACVNDRTPKNEELYNLAEDPEENENIVTEKVERGEKMKDSLCKIYERGLSEREAKEGNFSERIKHKEKLIRLGYYQRFGGL